MSLKKTIILAAATLLFSVAAMAAPSSLIWTIGTEDVRIKAILNGRELSEMRIPASELLKGGKLELWMVPEQR